MLEYLQSQYSLTRWPFFTAVELTNKFGEQGREELNRLKAEGKIKRRIFINGALVELITE